MQMMGTFVFLIKAFKAPIPPRSPALVPSTSSIIKQERPVSSGRSFSLVFVDRLQPMSIGLGFNKLTWPVKKPSRTVLSTVLLSMVCIGIISDSARSRNGGLSLTSSSFLLLVSEAFISIGLNPHSFAIRCAEVVFPIPGGPEIKTALKIPQPSFPGFVKRDLTFFGLVPSHDQSMRDKIRSAKRRCSPCFKPFPELLDLPGIPA